MRELKENELRTVNGGKESTKEIISQLLAAETLLFGMMTGNPIAIMEGYAGLAVSSDIESVETQPAGDTTQLGSSSLAEAPPAT
jgi:hypothetical protein